MSGGSFEYAGSRASWQAADIQEKLNRQGSGIPDPDMHAALHGFAGTIRTAVAETVMHDIEWFFSNDTGEDCLRLAISGTWPSLELPDGALGRPDLPSRYLSEFALAHTLLEFADHLRVKLDEESAVYYNGSRDDVPADIRVHLKAVIPFLECVAHATVVGEQVLQGDADIREVLDSMARWPKSLLAAGVDALPSPADR